LDLERAGGLRTISAAAAAIQSRAISNNRSRTLASDVCHARCMHYRAYFSNSALMEEPQHVTARQSNQRTIDPFCPVPDSSKAKLGPSVTTGL
jgi:hypothetical protein